MGTTAGGNELINRVERKPEQVTHSLDMPLLGPGVWEDRVVKTNAVAVFTETSSCQLPKGE